jgi:hypothetical protein
MLNRRHFLSAVLPVLAAACACSDEEQCEDLDNREMRRRCLADRDGGNPNKPTPVPEPEPEPQVHTFEFRVTGTVRRVDISHSSTSEGTTLLTTDLPWFATIRSTRVLMFLALTVAAREFDEGTLTAQLFVDGQLFREAHATGLGPTVTISGQWAA